MANKIKSEIRNNVEYEYFDVDALHGTDTTSSTSGRAADAAVVGALKSGLDQVSNPNLFGAVTTGYYINDSGQPTEYDSSAYTDYIAVTAGEEYTLIYSQNVQTSVDYRLRVHYYDAGKTWLSQTDTLISKSSTGELRTSFVPPVNSAFVRISFYFYTAISDIWIGRLDGGFQTTAIDKVARSGMADVEHAVKKLVSDRTIDFQLSRSDLSVGAITPTGSVVSVSSAGYTQPFAVEPGEIITVKKYYVSNGELKGEVAGVFGSYAFFTDDPNTYTGRGANWGANASSITIPSDVHYLQATINAIMSGTYTRSIITRSKPNGQVDYFPVQNTFEAPLIFRGTLQPGVYQPLGGRVCVDDYILTITGKVSDGFSSFKIGGSNAAGTAFMAPTIEITATQVIMKSNTATQWDVTEAHGLTIADDLQVMVIASKDTLHAKVIVQSGGSRWESPAAYRIGTSYYGFGLLSAESMTEVTASVSIRDLYAPVWVCGDSWVTNYPERWYGQALALDLVHFLHSGHSGEGSADGLRGLKTLLNMYTPKMILWLYGMNDADTNDTTPNAAWSATLQELQTICDNRTVELVLATIPTTPTINNNAKNAVVAGSGYRYVDEATAMGADNAGNWIAGYQSSDGNHTTAAGAKALLAQVLVDVPEIALMQQQPSEQTGKMDVPSNEGIVGQVLTKTADGSQWQGHAGAWLTEEIKVALLTIAEKAGYSDTHGQDYYDALYNALYPPATLLSISAVFSQGSHVVYDTDTLDSLKQYLVVVAHYDDNTDTVVSDYTLSGTLAVGTSTVTVSFGGKTTTFTVTVTEYDTQPVIQTEGVCWSKNIGQTVAKEGFGVTKWYHFAFAQEDIENCQYWDATNGYMTINGWSGFRYYISDVNTLAAGYSWPASNNYKIAKGKDDTYLNYSSMTINTEVNAQFERHRTDELQFNSISLSLPLLDLDDCYAYWHKQNTGSIFPVGVNEGDIIFAGKNTPYYKLHNISEASGT